MKFLIPEDSGSEPEISRVVGLPTFPVASSLISCPIFPEALNDKGGRSSSIESDSSKSKYSFDTSDSRFNARG